MYLLRSCLLLVFLLPSAGVLRAQSRPPISPVDTTTRQKSNDPAASSFDEFNVSYGGGLSRQRLAEIAADEKKAAHQKATKKAAFRPRHSPLTSPVTNGRPAPTGKQQVRTVNPQVAR